MLGKARMRPFNMRQSNRQNLGFDLVFSFTKKWLVVKRFVTGLWFQICSSTTVEKTSPNDKYVSDGLCNATSREMNHQTA